MLGAPMKKLGILIAVASLAFAAPVFACPHDENTPKTADKAKDEKGQDKAKETPKKEEKAPETAKAPAKKEEPKKEAPKKEEPKKPAEKVSQK
jgi:hypothetical protein